MFSLLSIGPHFSEHSEGHLALRGCAKGHSHSLRFKSRALLLQCLSLPHLRLCGQHLTCKTQLGKWIYFSELVMMLCIWEQNCSVSFQVVRMDSFGKSKIWSKCAVNCLVPPEPNQWNGHGQGQGFPFAQLIQSTERGKNRSRVWLASIF